MLTRALLAGVLLGLCLAACGPTGDPPVGDTSLFVVVHIPEGLNPLERGARYQTPLDAALRARGLGEVTGGGTQLGPRRPDGTHDELSVDIDVELTDAQSGLHLVRAEMRRLKAPRGTVLSYQRDGQPIREPLW